MNYFISGTQINQQVFPYPYITTNEQDKVVIDISAPLIESTLIETVFMENQNTVIAIANQNQMYYQKLST